MNDEILVALGRERVEWVVQKEGLIRRVQALEKELAKAKAVIEIHESKKKDAKK